MFLPIFYSLCVQKISCVQHFTSTHLYLEFKYFLKENLCARTCAQLRGNIGQDCLLEHVTDRLYQHANAV